MRKLLDADDPFFRQPWRRWATAILPILWGGYEFWGGNPMWGLLFVGAGAYAGWVLIVKGPTPPA